MQIRPLLGVLIAAIAAEFNDQVASAAMMGQPLVVMSLLLLATNAVKGPQEAPFVSALVNTPRALAEATGVWLI